MTTKAATVTTTPEPVTQPDSSLITAFKAARRVSTPIVAIETPDAAATIVNLRGALNGKTPTLSWDITRGLRSLNEKGDEALAGLGIATELTVNPTESLMALEKAPELTVVFCHNFHRQLSEISVVQALWNLRDHFKVNKRMVVLLGPTFQLPAELAGDVIVLDEPLPTRAELSAVLDQQHKNGAIALPAEDIRTQALDAVVGLPNFTAEQVIAMSLTKTGIDVPKLWERKVKAIENTDGLSVWKHTKPAPMADLRGIDNVCAFMEKLIAADAFGAIVFMDELDKVLSGGLSEHTGDSGVSKDQVGQILTYIQDNDSLGVLLAGVAGTGKTQLAKAVGYESGKPVIVFDLGGMKGGVVGKSERQIRAALKVVTATAEGRVLFIGTANRTTMFTPELNRRFADQFFFDVPDEAGRQAIWPVYTKKFGLLPAQAAIPPGFDAGWTGAEIERACKRAALFGWSVVDAARFIIPSSVSGAKAIEALRRDAAGRFLSASHPGLYRPSVTAPAAGAARAIDVHES